MDDAISRHGVFAWLCNMGHEHLADAIMDENRFPSAQTDLDEWCTDCKEYDQERHSCPRWNRVIRETLKDVQEERNKDVIQKFYDYQVKRLEMKYDPMTRNIIKHFLDNTTNDYLLKLDWEQEGNCDE